MLHTRTQEYQHVMSLRLNVINSEYQVLSKQKAQESRWSVGEDCRSDLATSSHTIQHDAIAIPLSMLWRFEIARGTERRNGPLGLRDDNDDDIALRTIYFARKIKQQHKISRGGHL